MPQRRRVDPAEGRAAVQRWSADPESAPREIVATAVRHTLAELAAAYPGNAVEVRVPPFAAVQCLPGVTHRRGTPPNVVEVDAVTWLELAVGRLDWAGAIAAGRVSASGDRADLAGLIPLL